MNINLEDVKDQLCFYVKTKSDLNNFVSSTLNFSEENKERIRNLIYLFYNEQISYNEFLTYAGNNTGLPEAVPSRSRKVWKEIYGIKVYTKQKYTDTAKTNKTNYILYENKTNINAEIKRVGKEIYSEDSSDSGVKIKKKDSTEYYFSYKDISINNNLPENIENINILAELLNGNDADSIKFQNFHKELLNTLIHY